MEHHVKNIGVFAFLGGSVIAILMGSFSFGAGMTAHKILILAVLGIIAGYLNIAEHELQLYLIATLTLIGVSNVFTQVLVDVPVIGLTLVAIFQNLLIFFAAGAGILALKVVLDFASD
jgi:hypothetical protein